MVPFLEAPDAQALVVRRAAAEATCSAERIAPGRSGRSCPHPTLSRPATGRFRCPGEPGKSSDSLRVLPLTHPGGASRTAAALRHPSHVPERQPETHVSLRALTLVQEKFPTRSPSSTPIGPEASWAVVKPDALRQVMAHLKDDPHLDFKLFLSIDAVDRLQLPEHDPRFEVVYLPLLRSAGTSTSASRSGWRRAPPGPQHHLHLPGRRLVGALRLGLLRHPLRRPPRPPAHPHVRGIQGAPAPHRTTPA